MKKGIRVLSIFVAIVILCAFLVVKVVIPEMKYNAAMELVQEGSYEKAIAICKKIENYKDVSKLIAKAEELQKDAIITSKIESAQKLHNEGNTTDAYKMIVEYQDNDDVIKLLEVYEKEMLEKVSSKVICDDTTISDCYLVNSVDSKNEGPVALGIFFVQSKEDTSENNIYLYYRFYHGSKYAFTTPVHPHTLKLQTDNGEIDISIGVDDREFTSSGGLWFESILTQITLEQANEIAEIYKSFEEIDVRAIGSSSYHDEQVAENGVVDIIDYINVAVLISK